MASHNSMAGRAGHGAALESRREDGRPCGIFDLQRGLVDAPYLKIGGWHNHGEVFHAGSYNLLMADKGSTWLAASLRER